jgi:fluoroquinolone transport system permease protein
MFRTEARVQARERVWLSSGAVSLAMAAVLVAVDRGASRAVAPYALLFEVATVGAVFAASLTLLDRTVGVFAALSTTPQGVRFYVPARLGILTALSLTLALVVGAAGAHGWFAVVPVLVAVGLTALLLDALSVAIAARASSLFGFLSVAPLLLVPLLAVPLAWAVFALDVPLLRLVPTVGAWELLQAGYTPIPIGRLLTDAAYLTLWAVGAFVLATRRIAAIDHAGQPPAPTVALQRRTRPPRRAPHRLVPASIDAINAFRNPLALALAASPLVLAAAIRLGLPPFAPWLSRTHGVDLTGLEPLIFSGLILLHVPYIFGVVATLLLLDDLDEGGLRALSVSPLGVRGYLRYRTASTALAALLAVIAATVIAGPPDGIGWPRLGLAWLLAAACAPLVPLTTATLANNRVQGFGILKVLGLVYYLPLIGWTLHGWASILVGALPTYWPAALAWGERSPNTLVLILAGAGIAVLAMIVELRLGERHLIRRIGHAYEG